MGGAVARPKRRSANPRRRVTAAVRCALAGLSRASPDQTGGAPLRPSGGNRRTSTAATAGRPVAAPRRRPSVRPRGRGLRGAAKAISRGSGSYMDTFSAIRFDLA